MDNLATVASGESREMDEDIVLPFEVDMECSGDLLSLSEEMNHLLDPRVYTCINNSYTLQNTYASCSINM